MAIIDELKLKYKQGSMLMRIIYINIAIFVVMMFVGLFGLLFNYQVLSVFKWVELSSNPWEVLYKPWTLITYSFCHTDMLHILFNMLWLYWMGRIFLEYFTSKQLAGLYVLGALGGAALFLLAYSYIPAFSSPQSYMLGASASVIAIVVATAVYSPDYKIGLLFIGMISLKWVAIVTLLVDLLSINTLENAGGHIAHLGGAVVGAVYALMMRRGHDITAPLNATIDALFSLFSRKNKPGVGGPVGGTAYRGNNQQQSHAKQQPNETDLDRVLAKIKRSGYTALTDEERDILFSFSKKK